MTLCHMKLVFLPSKDEILIHEVHNNPTLYDIAAMNYKNNIKKETIFKNLTYS